MPICLAGRESPTLQWAQKKNIGVFELCFMLRQSILDSIATSAEREGLCREYLCILTQTARRQGAALR